MFKMTVFCFSQTPAEISHTDQGAAGGKRIDGHADLTRQRRAELFVNVAQSRTVFLQRNTAADLLSEISHLSHGK